MYEQPNEPCYNAMYDQPYNTYDTYNPQYYPPRRKRRRHRRRNRQRPYWDQIEAEYQPAPTLTHVSQPSREPVICYRCGQPGHYAFACRVRLGSIQRKACNFQQMNTEAKMYQQRQSSGDTEGLLGSPNEVTVVINGSSSISTTRYWFYKLLGRTNTSNISTDSVKAICQLQHAQPYVQTLSMTTSKATDDPYLPSQHLVNIKMEQKQDTYLKDWIYWVDEHRKPRKEQLERSPWNTWFLNNYDKLKMVDGRENKEVRKRTLRRNLVLPIGDLPTVRDTDKERKRPAPTHRKKQKPEEPAKSEGNSENRTTDEASDEESDQEYGYWILDQDTQDNTNSDVPVVDLQEEGTLGFTGDGHDGAESIIFRMNSTAFVFAIVLLAIGMQESYQQVCSNRFCKTRPNSIGCEGCCLGFKCNGAPGYCENSKCFCNGCEVNNLKAA
ncbi:Hypothetical predicted protein, partial [Mytilus galloprovincialis]